MTEHVVVIIVNWNGLKHLRRCLPALLAKEKVVFETIIVDNSSTDGSVTWLQTNYSTVQRIRNAENRDLAEVNNQGIQATTDEYVVLQKNDTQPTLGWMSGLVAVAVCDARVACQLGDGKLNFGNQGVSDRRKQMTNFTQTLSLQAPVDVGVASAAR